VLSRNEIERLASAIHGLRPDWPVASLVEFISRRDTRPLLDLTVELCWVAQLPDTKTPGRIDEDGPWKSAVRSARPASMTSLLEPVDFGTACTVCLKPREHLWHGGTGTVSDHDFAHPKDHETAPRPKENE
jgi:hypothetical protein